MTSVITSSSRTSRPRRAAQGSECSCPTGSSASIRATCSTKATAAALYLRSPFLHSPADRLHQVFELDRLHQVIARVEAGGHRPRTWIGGSCDHDRTRRLQGCACALVERIRQAKVKHHDLLSPEVSER